MNEEHKVLNEEELDKLFESESNIDGTVIGLLEDIDTLKDMLEANITVKDTPDPLKALLDKKAQEEAK